MQVLTQSVRNGQIHLRDAPWPAITPTEVLVDTRASLISSGTERHLRELASSSLIGKARERPDLVRQVLDRLRRDGVRETWKAVSQRLDEEMPLGYSAAGVVLEVGEAVSGIRAGDRVATAGAGHGELQVVAGNLATRLGASLTFEQAAFGAVGSVALHAHRLAEIGPGDRVVVIGLGLVGQLAAQLAHSTGAQVAALDLDDWKVDVARGADVVAYRADDAGWDAIEAWSQGRGADVVVVTAATASSEPMRRALTAARDRGTVVIVGDVGLDLDRRPFYERELTLKIARSYGPGRYDPSYESVGVDYPYGQVRWTAGRNLEAIVELIASRRIDVEPLISHRYPFREVQEAYETLETSDEVLGVVLTYETTSGIEHRQLTVSKSETSLASTGLASGLIGAGRFAESVLLPLAGVAGFGPWTGVVSSGGQRASRIAESFDFQRVATDPDSVLTAEDTDVVFIATPHSSHAELTAAALKAGKHVFCEKPLAITEPGLRGVISAFEESQRSLMIGFNRRWSQAVEQVRTFVSPHGSPIQIQYRVFAGSLPDDHWLNDRREGGRLVGEACHFIDTCIALIGEDPNIVYTVGSGEGELSLEEDFTIVLGFGDGSQASIVYNSTSPPSVGKESIEILGRDCHVRIDDFATVTLTDGRGSKSIRHKPPDKGHGRQFEVFRGLIEGRKPADEIANSAFVTMHTTFAALRAMTTGGPVILDFSP